MADCDCTVCVTPESHASGALTIGAAIEQVKQTRRDSLPGGGRVPAGRAGGDPRRAVGAPARAGPGYCACRSARGGIDVRRSIAVTVENLSVVTRPRPPTGGRLRLERCLSPTLRRCFVLNLAGEQRGGVAVRLAGYLVGASVEECVLHPDRRGRRNEDDTDLLTTISLRIEDNWLWCEASGVDLGPHTVHVADTRVTGNTIWGCREAGVIGPRCVRGGAFDVRENILTVEGSGILGGVDALRIADNDVRGGKATA